MRDSLKMILEYDGYDCLLARERPGRASPTCRAREPGSRVSRRQDAGHGWSRRPPQGFREIDETLVPVVMISGHGTVSTAVEATKLGAFDFLEKPLSTERVKVTIRNALDQRKLKDENRGWRRAAEVRHEMVGEQQAPSSRGDGGDPPGRAGPERRPDPGGERCRQGAGGTRDPSQQPTGQGAVRPGELRGDSRRPDRVRAVRAREGLLSPARPRSRSASSSRRTAGTIFLDEVGDMTLEDAGEGAACSCRRARSSGWVVIGR